VYPPAYIQDAGSNLVNALLTSQITFDILALVLAHVPCIAPFLVNTALGFSAGNGTPVKGESMHR